jgi:hypothetical protein
MIRRTQFTLPFFCRITLPTVLAVTAATGCGNPEGNVTGAVYHRGIPVVAGHVNFFDPGSGKGGRGALDSAGRYALEGTLPPGNYQVYVTPPPPPLPRADDPPPRPPHKPEESSLPRRYTSPETSGATVTVTSGRNELVVMLGE